MYTKLAGAMIDVAYKELQGKNPKDIKESAVFFSDMSENGMLFLCLGAISGCDPAGTLRAEICRQIGERATFAIKKADAAIKELVLGSTYKAQKHKKKGEMQLELWVEAYRKNNKNPKIEYDKTGQPIALEYSTHSASDRVKTTHIPVTFGDKNKHETIRTDGSKSQCRFGEMKFLSTKAFLKFCMARQEKFECEGCPCGHEIMSGRRTSLTTNIGIVRRENVKLTAVI
jgi:hypothetical protein